MHKSIIQELAEFGQSIWLDYISRSLMDSGKLQRLIDQGLRGLTSNPSIFNKAIGNSDDYDTEIADLKKQGKSTFDVYDTLTMKDIQHAADMFKPVWHNTDGEDGYVSLEINPKYAYDTDRTINEGQRLFRAVDRPNLMLKVPSTNEGFPAVTALLAKGINVNVTLIFSLKQYVQTAQAYLEGTERFIDNGGDARNLCSVASIFVSRVDTLTDTIIENRIDGAHDEDEIGALESLRGKAAIANAALIYRQFRHILTGDRYTSLAKKGARMQRVLWGSTSTKNPAYSDIKYVSDLIAHDTVNTIPEKTLSAFMDHGEVREALTAKATEADSIISTLSRLDIDLDTICNKLLDDGVVAFEKAFDSLLESIEKKAQSP
jgi:transaldolase